MRACACDEPQRLRRPRPGENARWLAGRGHGKNNLRATRRRRCARTRRRFSARGRETSSHGHARRTHDRRASRRRRDCWSARSRVVGVVRGDVPEVHHPDQLWWPEMGLRKRDALEYYAQLAPVVLPHLRNRPFTIKQHYNGPRSPFRWLKDKPSDAPTWVRTTSQPAKSRRGALVQYVVVRDARTLLWLVDYGAIDLHVWTSRIDKPDRPDVVLLDLDPHEAPFAAVVEAALLLREALDALGLEAVPMTTGGDGMHVRVPIVRRHVYP